MTLSEALEAVKAARSTPEAGCLGNLVPLLEEWQNQAAALVNLCHAPALVALRYAREKIRAIIDNATQVSGPDHKAVERLAREALALLLPDDTDDERPAAPLTGWHTCIVCTVPLPPDWKPDKCRQCEAMDTGNLDVGQVAEAAARKLFEQGRTVLATMPRAGNPDASSVTGVGELGPKDPLGTQADTPEDSIDWLIDRMKLVPEMAQGGTEPISTRAMVLANLHQAKQLERIADSFERLGRVPPHLFGASSRNPHFCIACGLERTHPVHG